MENAEENAEFLEFIDFVENAEERVRRPKKYLRDVENPLEFYEDDEFTRRYRFSKNLAQRIILPLVLDALTKVNNRGLPVPPIIQLLICLRYYATGNFQVVSGDLRGISQQTVSRITKTVSELIAEHLPQHIYIPRTEQQLRQNIGMFRAVREFPGVGGCVDCTHIRIVSPGGEDAEVYRNRKGFFSLNVQVAVGPQMEMLNVVVRHPGSTHDSVIFDRSSLRVQCERGELGILLGDNGYPCRPYLLTPVIHPANPREQRYNRAHITTRNIVERVFGVWKRRFPCLYRGISTSLRTAQAIICATSVLYNISVRHRDNFDIEEAPGEIAEQNGDYINLPNNNEHLGLLFRNNFIENHF